jgi:hypothetical protein
VLRVMERYEEARDVVEEQGAGLFLDRADAFPL